MPTALVTLGRLPKCLDIVAALSKAGWRVVVAEPFAWHLCRLSRHCSKTYTTPAPNADISAYQKSLLDIIDAENVSLVVPVSEEALFVTRLEDQLPGGVTLYADIHSKVAQLHDKYAFSQLCSELGLAVPETCLLGSEAATELAARSDCVIKPARTCSGQGLSLRNAGEPLPKPSDDTQILVQKRLPGAHKSTFSIAHRGQVIGTVVYKAAIFTDTVAAAFERLESETQIEAWVEQIVTATNYSGFISFDFIDDSNGIPHAIECNPRATSGIHFVEQSDLAKCMITPGSIERLRFRDEKLLHQFWPTLTEVQNAAIRRNGFKEKFRVFRQARDVNFSWADPLPLWLMPFASANILWRSFVKGETFGEASTFDVAWFGDSALPDGNAPLR